ncbi:OPT oligopeptide transporter protein-domain-containing protein [Fomitopsis serialis]|uniref:OPT oligopeptide transporter protein-domain-containing protein n=1 Tax=Fomitopsis serialis TaxID=139415 RepID=UPI0020074FA5|nr:OPT oligopeptide transporter protein-domain-containing protein [Neoantrodia serialis]KAH9930132.1 OPT oligopeptide transporter protein-domain-containing protein [Neoantrodia serialis]
MSIGTRVKWLRRQARRGAGKLDGGQQEFTFRVAFCGLLIGCLLCFTNLYFGLQTGWISMMSLQSALIGFLVSKFFPTPMSPQENVVLQTIAVATGTMPLAAGFVGILPALSLLDEERDGVPALHLSWLDAVGWSLAIIEEQLAFPSGTATAQLISVLHQIPPPDTTPTARQRHGSGIPDPDTPGMPMEEEHLVADADEWLWTFTPVCRISGKVSIIMGFPTTLSMNLGMLVGWAILSPVAKHSGRRTHVMDDKEVESPDRLVPTRWVAWGLGGSVVFGTILVWVVFGDEGIKPWATFLGFVMGGLLSVLGCRSRLGETDLNPVSGLGKISQLFFAWIQPGNIVANIIAGGVAEAGAQQAGDLMQDLKTGHLIHASPRAQFFGQLLGSLLSILVTTTAYTLYQRAYEIPGPSFPAPTAYVWLGLARLLRDGELPAKSKEFMVIFAAIFGAVAAVKAYAQRQGLPHAKWIPSGVAFAIGFLNTPSFSIARLIGGIVEHVYYTRVGRDKGGIKLIIIASGFVLGEGVVSIVSLVLRTWGIGVASCWGCGHGMCGGCPA